MAAILRGQIQLSGGKKTGSVSVEVLYIHLSPAVYASESLIVTPQALGLDMISTGGGFVKLQILSRSK